MKYSLILSILFSILMLSSTNAQDDTNSFNKLDLTLTTGIGYGQVKNDNEPNYNLNANIGEALLTYNFNKNFGLSTGFGWLQLSGNGFNSYGNFYHERDYIKIPLLVRSTQSITDKLNLLLSAGFYGQTIINEEHRYLLSTEKDAYEGWCFGFQGAFGFEYEVSSNWTVGINIATQSDFNKLETRNNASFQDEQNIQTLNTIGLLFGFKF